MGAIEDENNDIFNGLILTEEEIDRLSNDLKDQLVQYGWKDVLRARCNEAAKSKITGEFVSVDELVSIITPIAQGLIPDNVKANLLKKIQNILDRRVNEAADNTYGSN